jgi:peptide/nickel transport system permease protein
VYQNNLDLYSGKIDLSSNRSRILVNSLIRRLLFIPLILIGINFFSFAYALIALRVQKAANPWGSSASGELPILQEYTRYVSGWLQNNIGTMPGSDQSILQTLSGALFNSLGLLLIAFSVAAVAGLLVGFAGIKLHPARTSAWLNSATTIGLAVPGFFIAALFIAVALFYPVNAWFPPVSGFGWDAHLLIPVLVLAIRPAAQVAQTAASLVVAEIDRQYITTARSIGHTWASAIRKHAFRSALAPILLILASTFRWAVAELILVEWIFAWPGLGRLLAQVLIPPQTAGPGSFGSTSIIFLNPPILAAIMTIFSFIFLLSDLVASSFARQIDPRLRSSDSGVQYG